MVRLPISTAWDQIGFFRKARRSAAESDRFHLTAFASDSRLMRAGRKHVGLHLQKEIVLLPANRIAWLIKSS
jgi:hypothetical protein